MEVLGIDVGGSGIKGALVDTEKGVLTTERHRIPTPKSLMPEDVLPVFRELVEAFDYAGPLGVGFPAVVVDGCPITPFTAHHIMEWVHYPVADKISQITGLATTLVNDADAAGLAEMSFGAGRDVAGTVVTLVLGTGIGSGLFLDGKLLPNTEFGSLVLKGHDATIEHYVSDRVREAEDLKWKQFAERLDEYLHHVNLLVRPNLIILGGGVSKKHEKYIPRLTVDCQIVPATLRNEAGIVGAAMAAIR